MSRLPVVCALAFALGCTPAEGLRSTPDGDGPMVYIDWDAEPLPELPFPNDLATRPDPSSPTGLRLNFSREAPTQTERDLRTKADQQTGFGIYAPVMVRFHGRLDLDAVLARHGVGDVDFRDDAVYVIDVTPGSPTWLQPAELDLGGERFPIDLPSTGDFWPNDPRADEATLLFETVDEDLNGDGVLQPHEDTDNDGVLDAPNTLPEGSTDRQDLIEWYERETDTLMFRPVVPLREKTTYAVVLTERLTDETGRPVRSPWDWVHHTRQTEALQPLTQALPLLGLGVDDVAFAWTFTTADVTGDLLAVRQGLHGLGPFKSLQEDFPPTVTESLPMQDPLGDRTTHRLPMARIISPLASAGVLPGGEEGFIAQSYLQYGDEMVTGVFHTPNFLVDTDDDGFDDTDEWWRVDASTGEMIVEPQRVPFTCITPKPSEGHQAPFPVVMIGHGQGGTRFHLVILAWAFNRMGMAACGFDFPGHGGALPPDQEEKYSELLESLGLLPAFRSFSDARHRDLDNDGLPDSGADFWVADPFHTRDNVRQAATDFAQFTRVLKACGTGTMDFVTDGGAVVSSAMSCDWNEDGVPDVGGPDAAISIFGASLGGINTSVAVAIEPHIAAAVPMIPGGGLGDGLLRSSLGGPREAVIGRLLSPLLLGIPDGDGVRVEQMVVSSNNMVSIPIGTLPEVPLGGRVVVENLDNGERHEGGMPDDGRFRVPIAADAMTGGEKRRATGMPEWGPSPGAVYSVPDNHGLGDRLRITVLDAAGAEVAVLDRFEGDVVHEGVTYPAGSPLVAGNSGSGHIRQTPRLRRLIQVMSMIGESGDPIAHSPRWFHEPLAHGGGPANVLLMPTVGDDVVPIATGIALARSARLFGTRAIDSRYDMPVDQWLVERGVVHGYEELGPYTDGSGNPILFDVEDFDGGVDGAPSDEPLRATVDSPAGSSGLRVIYADPRGSHGWRLPEPGDAFDINTFATMQSAWFLATEGRELRDDACLASATCPWFRTLD